MDKSIAEQLLQHDGVFMLPEYQSDAYEWHGHIPFAFWITALLKPSRYVELGTYKGDSYCAFCQAIQKQKIKATCFAVDTWRGDEHVGQYDNAVYDSLRVYHDSHYADFSRLMRTTFAEASATFQDQSVDLLHIDGLHTYDAVKDDYVTWLPKLSSRGVILFHDLTVKERGFGVWKLWEEIRNDFPSFHFNHSNGLGVLLTGKDVPKELIAIAESSSEDLRVVQMYFAALGDRIQQKAQVTYWQKMKDNLFHQLECATSAHKATAQLLKELKIRGLDTDKSLSEIEEAYKSPTGNRWTKLRRIGEILDRHRKTCADLARIVDHDPK